MFSLKRNILKNPFIYNIRWLSVLSVLALLFLFLPFLNSSINELWKHIITGVFYSALVLLINEFVQLFRDKKELGILKGKYIRTELFQVLEGGKKAEQLTQTERDKIEAAKQQVVEGTRYSKVFDVTDLGWEIELIYLFKGSYSGIAKYQNHLEGGDANVQTDIFITVHLNDDLNTGDGTYQYKNFEVFGTYSLHISPLEPNKIIVGFKNIIPSGIAEGYEIWEKR
ncbi:MAG TPA: hypothetical protein VKB95_16905 [Chitinophagaceae bacterium]|nr:hypothetical protein [Chitinophagaceae bacterium]